jgi:tetratricopeptide (TPR) repeat protein
MVAIKKKGVLALLVCSTTLWQACDPPGPSALLRGERLIHDGKYQAAVDSLREATTLLPNNPQAWNHLGLAYHWARQYNQAVQAYRRAVELNYDLAPARFNLGSLLLEINQPQLAANEFAAYTLLKPEQVEGWVRRGMAEWRARNWDAAYESFQKAVGINHARPVVWNSIGVIELYRKNAAGAEKAFREALRHKPDYAPAIYNMGLVSQFYLSQKPDDHRPIALAKYREYLALQPTPLFTDVIRRIADQLDTELNPKPVQVAAPPRTNIVALAQPPPAISQLPVSVPPPAPVTNVTVAVVEPIAPPIKPVVTNQPVVPVRPPDPPPVKRTNIVIAPASPVTNTTVIPIRVARVETPPTPEKVDVSPPPVAKIEEVRPSPAPAVAMSRGGDSDPSLAATAARNIGSVPAVRAPTPAPEALAPAFAEIAPNYAGLRYSYLSPPVPSTGFRHKAKPHFEEGRRLQKLRRWDDAIHAYRRAIQWDGSYFEAYHNLGLAAAANADFLRSAVASETALALQPNSAGTRYNFAVLLNGKGYHRDAAIELEKLLQQETDDVKSHLLLATIYDKQLRQAARAGIHYERVMTLQPAHPQGTAIRYWLRSH